MISAEGAGALIASPRRRGAFRFLRRPTARIGALIVLAFLMLTAAAPVIVPYGPLDQDFLQPLAPPSTEHLLGTDQYGRDLLSRVIYGSRTALMSILVADGIALVLGSALGLVAGFYAGKVDSLIMRLMDVLLAFPYLLLALIIVAALGPSLLNSMIAIGIVYTPQYARLIRGQVLAVKAQDFVQAARSAGGGAHAADAAPYPAEQLHANPGHGDPAGRHRGRGDRRSVVPRPWRPAALARLGRHSRRRPGLFPDRLVDRDLPRPRHFDRGAGLQSAG